jgi:hypothetical protein
VQKKDQWFFSSPAKAWETVLIWADWPAPMHIARSWQQRPALVIDYGVRI